MLIRRTTQKGFTIIELLVVISIVSFLSSIILASLNTARNRARLNAGLYLDAQLEHQGVQLTHLNFDNSDLSDISNNTITSSNVTYVSDTYSGTGKSAKFTSSGYIRIEDKNELNFSTDKSFVLSAWIKTTIKNHQRVISKGHFGFSPGYVLQVSHYGKPNTLQITAGVNDTYIYGYGPTLNDNKWHHIAAVFNRKDQTITMYVDGSPVPFEKYSGSCGTKTSSGTSLNISGCNANATTNQPLCFGGGNSNCASEEFYGLIDDPMVLESTLLNASTINNLYTLQKKNHLDS